MLSMNKVMLVGVLTKDPNVRVLQSGHSMATFSLAIDESYVDNSGKAVKKISYPNCQIWGSMSDQMKGMKKGEVVGVLGKLTTGSYENKYGQKVYTTTVTVEKLETFSENELKRAVGKDPMQDTQPLDFAEFSNTPADGNDFPF